MKKIAIILLFIAAFSACSEDFLDKKPLGKLSQEVFFSEEEGVEGGINAIYTMLRSWDLVGFSWFGICELPSDNSNTGSHPGDGSFARVNTFNMFTYDATTSEQNGWWTGNYKGIAYSNLVIDNINVLKDEAAKTKGLAQARFFRAFFYFNLVQAFGDVPKIMNVITDPTQYALPRSPEDEIYNEIIIPDLTYAAENLPTRSEWGAANLGRMTKGTAQGLLAKVYLFRQDYANAKKYAGDAINGGEYSLHTDYRDLFAPTLEAMYSPEVMMSGQFWWGAETGRNINSEFVKWQGVRSTNAKNFGWAFGAPSKELNDAYETGDPRKAATIFYSGETVDGHGQVLLDMVNAPMAYKKRIWPKSYWNTGAYGKMSCNLAFLRYADVLLIYAEASNELGNTDDALAKLEMVRKRARGNVEYVAGTNPLPKITERDKAALRLLIWKERRIELATEGHRFFDIIRADKVVPGYANTALKTFVNGAGETVTTNFDITKHSRFQIPQTQIDLTFGALTQN